MASDNVDLLALEYPQICGPLTGQQPANPQPPTRRYITPGQLAQQQLTVPTTVTAPATTQPTLSASQQFRALLAEVEKEQPGIARARALAKVIRENTELHAAYLAEVNQPSEPTEPVSSATVAYRSLVTARMKAANCSRSEAMKFVNTNYPTERKAFVAETNR